MSIQSKYPALNPSLLLDFANSQSVDPRITFTRASTATRINSKGLIETVASGVPRIGYDPVTLACKGLRIEPAATNLLLNSLLNGTNLSTQSVTVTAAAHTLSFYGTGTVALSGAYSSSVVGAGAYPTKTTLTFTPGAGTLTLTVSGTVQFAQLEAGSAPTSYIPTAGAAVTRAADLPVMTGANFSSWYRQGEGTVFVEYELAAAGVSAGIVTINKASDPSANNIAQRYSSGGAAQFQVVDGGASQASIAPTGYSAPGVYKRAALFTTDRFQQSINGVLDGADTTGTVPLTVDQLLIGSEASGTNFMSGYIRRVAIYPAAVSGSELQALTS